MLIKSIWEKKLDMYYKNGNPIDFYTGFFLCAAYLKLKFDYDEVFSLLKKYIYKSAEDALYSKEQENTYIENIRKIKQLLNPLIDKHTLLISNNLYKNFDIDFIKKISRNYPKNIFMVNSEDYKEDGDISG